VAGRGAFLPLQLPAQPQTARQRTLTLATLPAGPRPRLVRVPPRSENTFDTPMSTSSKQRGAAQQRCEGGWQNPRAITTTRSSAGQPEQATQLGSASNSGAPITSSAAGMQRDRSPVDKSGTRAGFESMRWIVRGASAWRVAHARGRTAGAAGCSSVAEGTGAWSRGRQRRTERVRMLLSSTGCAGAIKLPRWGSHRMIEPGGANDLGWEATAVWSRGATAGWSCGSNDRDGVARKDCSGTTYSPLAIGLEPDSNHASIDAR